MTGDLRMRGLNECDDYDEEPIGYESGYDYDNLYGLLAVPFLGILISILTYLLKKYHCYTLLRFINFFQNVQTDDV